VQLLRLASYGPKETDIVDSLAKILLAADEAHAILNVPGLETSPKLIKLIVKKLAPYSAENAKKLISNFRADCYKQLRFDPSDFLSSSTIGRKIEPAMVRVLPKKKTPEVGISLRSLTQNISIWSTNEVLPRWYESGGSSISTNVSTAINLLLVPWPPEVRPAQFDALPPESNMAPEFGFFDFKIENVKTINTEDGGVEIDQDQLVTNHVKKLLSKAQSDIGRIDAVVFPELSLNQRSFDFLFEYLNQQDVALIAGLGDLAGETEGKKSKSTSVNQLEGGNQVRIQLPAFGELTAEDKPIVQSKHHRWKLESSQITQYGLGTILDVNKTWWENMAIARRTLNFIQLADRFVMCTIICEDLARQDPAAGLIRTVGPNLVIALLMDGPQIRTRWPSRYATVLAEDPTSSVLTLTSIGMTNLSRPPWVKCGSRSIGLWKDPNSGAVEINLDNDAAAVVLCLAMNKSSFHTADGRKSRFEANTPVFSGLHQISKKKK